MSPTHGALGFSSNICTGQQQSWWGLGPRELPGTFPASTELLLPSCHVGAALTWGGISRAGSCCAVQLVEFSLLPWKLREKQLFQLLQQFPFVFALLTKAAGFQKLQEKSSGLHYRKQNKQLLFCSQCVL